MKELLDPKWSTISAPPPCVMRKDGDGEQRSFEIIIFVVILGINMIERIGIANNSSSSDILRLRNGNGKDLLLRRR